MSISGNLKTEEYGNWLSLVPDMMTFDGLTSDWTVLRIWLEAGGYYDVLSKRRQQLYMAGCPDVMLVHSQSVIMSSMEIDIASRDTYALNVYKERIYPRLLVRYPLFQRHTQQPVSEQYIENTFPLRLKTVSSTSSPNKEYTSLKYSAGQT